MMIRVMHRGTLQIVVATASGLAITPRDGQRIIVRDEGYLIPLGAIYPFGNEWLAYSIEFALKPSMPQVARGIEKSLGFYPTEESAIQAVLNS
jgi:hypothetical protein